MKPITDQILIMSVIIILGYILRKRGYFSEVVTKDISKLLLSVILPLTIIESFMMPYNGELIVSMLIMAGLMALVTFIFIALAKVLFKEDQAIEKYATIFTNKGFIGIPIILALYGKEAIPLVTPMITVGHLFMWTYGLNLLTGEKNKISLKQIVTNSSFVAMIIGIILFILPIEYPYFITKSVSLLTGINTPMAMLILGVYLANVSILDTLKEKKSYYVAFIRLIVSPILVIFMMKWLPLDLLVKQIMIVLMAVPSASNTAMFAQLTNQDPTYGAQIVSKTTLFSALSLPFIIWIMEIIL